MSAENAQESSPATQVDDHVEYRAAKAYTNSTTTLASMGFVEINVVEEVILWKRWKLSLVILLVAITIWVMLQVYNINFVTLLSWAAILGLASLYLYGNVHKLVSKESPNMSGWQITEQSARDMADSSKKLTEEGIRWMFRVTVEREWYHFAGVVVTLLLIGYIARFFDLLTLLYTGTMVVMTVPVMYQKYEDKIQGYEEKVKIHARRFYCMFDQKVLDRMKHEMGDLNDKGKKSE